MRKTLKVVLAAVCCIIFAQSALAATMMNTPMGNAMSSRTAKFYAATKTESAERHLGAGADAIARAAAEDAKPRDESYVKENIYKMMLAHRYAQHNKQKVNRRTYKWGVSAPSTLPVLHGGLPIPKPAVATAAGNTTVETVAPQNVAG